MKNDRRKIRPEDRTINSADLPGIRAQFVCEDCDYIWTKEVPLSVEDSYQEGVELRLEDGRTSCPICGSRKTSRYEG